MKKLIALLLASVMAASLLAGCGGGSGTTDTPSTPAATDTSSSTTTTTTTDSSDTVADSGEFNAVVIRHQLIGWGNPGDAAMAEHSAKLNEVLASLGKPYTVELVFCEAGDYTNTTNLMLASGANEFDVIFTSNWAADALANAAAGYFTDLTPYLAKYPDIERVLTTDFMNASLVNGVNYVLPVNKEKARALGWILRKDIVDALGLDIAAIEALPPNQRLAALEPYFYRAYEEHGLWIFPNFVPSDYQFDRIIEPLIMGRNEDGAYTAVVADLEPDFINAVKLNSKWFADGLINPNLNNTSAGTTEFSTGNYFGVTYQLKPGKDKEEQNAIGYEVVQVYMNQPEVANSETTGAMIAIPIGAANPDEAFDYIHLLYTNVDVINTLQYGKEGVDYEIVGTGAGGVPIIERFDTWVYSQGWTTGNQFNNHLQMGEDPNKWAEFIAFNEAGRPLPLLGFTPDTSNTDVQTWRAGMDAVRENYGDLFRGYVPLDQIDATFEKLRSEYEAAGMIELLAEMQSQIDAWVASK